MKKSIFFPAVILLAASVSVFAAGELKPFPQHQSFTGCIKPTNVTQPQMDSTIKVFYNSYKSLFIKSNGSLYYAFQNNDTDANNTVNITTSEAHSYAMIITALMAGYDANAKTIFDGLTAFYLAHPSSGDNNTSGHVNKSGMNWAPRSATTNTPAEDAATDGDMGVAYALILASKQWGGTPTGNSTTYLQLAQNILTGMLGCDEMASSNNGYLQIADDAYTPTVTRTSDWIIDHLKAYEAIDPTNASKYEAFVTEIHTLLGTSTVCNTTTGLLPGFIKGTTPTTSVEGAGSDKYDYNSCRDPWRLAMAYMHSGDAVAKGIAAKECAWAYGQDSNFQLIDGGYTLAGSPNHSGWGTATAAFIAPYAVAACVSGTQKYANHAWTAAVGALNAYQADPTSGDNGIYDEGIRILSLLAASGNWWNPVGTTTSTKYTITASAGTGGAISPTGAVSVDSAGSQAFAVTPNAGYTIDSLLVDNVNQTTKTGYTFSNVVSAHTIRAVFKITTNAITASAGTGGTIAPNGVTNVNYGGSQAYTVAPSAGYSIDSLLVDNVSQTTTTAYTFTNVIATHTIRAVFKINTFTITASAGTGGAISPTGVTTVNYGGSQAYNVTPNAGYTIDSLLVDNVNQTTKTGYTFSTVSANHTIRAVFKITTNAITASAGTGGAIAPNGVTNVSYGGTQAYTVTPNAGYTIDSLLVDNVSQTTKTGYTFTSVTTTHTIRAVFKINIYTVTASSTGPGTISPSGSVQVSYGATQAFTISANAGSVLDSVKVDGVKTVISNGSYSFTNVTAAHTIAAWFHTAVITAQQTVTHLTGVDTTVTVVKSQLGIDTLVTTTDSVWTLDSAITKTDSLADAVIFRTVFDTVIQKTFASEIVILDTNFATIDTTVTTSVVHYFGYDTIAGPIDSVVEGQDTIVTKTDTVWTTDSTVTETDSLANSVVFSTKFDTIVSPPQSSVVVTADTIRTGEAIIDAGENNSIKMPVGIYATKTVSKISDGSVDLFVMTSKPASLKVEILDPLGNQLDQQETTSATAGVPHHFIWDMRNRNGSAAGAGSFVAVAKVCFRDGGKTEYKRLFIVK